MLCQRVYDKLITQRGEISQRDEAGALRLGLEMRAEAGSCTVTAWLTTDLGQTWR